MGGLRVATRSTARHRGIDADDKFDGIDGVVPMVDMFGFGSLDLTRNLSICRSERSTFEEDPHGYSSRSFVW